MVNFLDMVAEEFAIQQLKWPQTEV